MFPFRRKPGPVQTGVTLNELMTTLDPYLRVGLGDRKLLINVTDEGPFFTVYEREGSKAIRFCDVEESEERELRLDVVARKHTGKRLQLPEPLPNEDGITEIQGIHYAFEEPDGLRRFLDELLWDDYNATTIASLSEA